MTQKTKEFCLRRVDTALFLLRTGRLNGGLRGHLTDEEKDRIEKLKEFEKDDE